MKWNRGFTLIELLVVIAIISILAAIVTPRVGKYINKARMTKAMAEVRQAELALTDLMASAGVRDVRQLFTQQTVGALDDLAAGMRLYDLHTDLCYELLRVGRNADVGLYNGLQFRDEMKAKLGDSYLDLGKDPWGEKYQFYLGPLGRRESAKVGFRSWRVNPESNPDEEELYQPYIYNDYAKAVADQDLPGNPIADGIEGFPAPYNLSVYIYSMGDNRVIDQPLGKVVNTNFPLRNVEYGLDLLYYGGGDDINNWDNQQGWEFFYN